MTPAFQRIPKSPVARFPKRNRGIHRPIRSPANFGGELADEGETERRDAQLCDEISGC